MRSTLNAMRRQQRVSAASSKVRQPTRTEPVRMSTPPLSSPSTLEEQSAEPEQLSVSEQMDKGREFSRQRRETQLRTQSVTGSAQTGAGEAAVPGEKKEAAGSAFARLRSGIRSLRSQEAAAVAPDSESATAARMAAENTLRSIYTVAHETAEETCLTFADFGIISGPTSIGLYLARLGAFAYGGIFTIKVKGVEIPLIPTYTLPELIVRTSKILIVAAITAVVWGLIIVIVWAMFNPIDAFELFGLTFLKAMYALGLISFDSFTSVTQ